MKICGIYKITSPSGKVYIGQSVDCWKRHGAYKNHHCKKQAKLLASFEKHGFSRHKFEILHECTPCDLSSLEKYYVDLFQTFNSDRGLNIRDGGGNRASISEEQKAKISKTMTGRKYDPERVEKTRLKNLGRKLTKEQIERKKLTASRWNLGRKASPETRRRLSESHKGQVPWIKGNSHSDQTKQKLREASSGPNNWTYGKPRDQETRRKIAESVRQAHARRQQAARDSEVTNRGYRETSR